VRAKFFCRLLFSGIDGVPTMTAGRRPDPAEIKRAKGNPGRRPIADGPGGDAPGAGPAAAQPPDWLSTADIGTEYATRISDLAVQIWHELHPQLVGMNLLKPTDETSFALLCRAFAEAIDATRTLDREGYHYVTSSEHVGELKRPHPAVRFRKEAMQTVKELGDAFGLNPAARQRLFLQLAAQTGRVPGTAPARQAMGDDDDATADDAAPQAGRDGESPVGFLSRLN
jgi:P27 family predicted phage terminase small subunit